MGVGNVIQNPSIGECIEYKCITMLGDQGLVQSESGIQRMRRCGLIYGMLHSKARAVVSN